MIALVWGKEGTGKSTLALTFPKPLVHFDLDVGGFERAIWRMPQEGIVSKSYMTPIQTEKVMGAQQQGATIRFPRRVIGFKEVWQQIVLDFVGACQNRELRTIVVDSATQLWLICHTSLLQEKQEIQLASGMKETSDKFRERLTAIEFPNDRIRSVIYTARSCGKNLVMTHYPKDIYAEKLVNERIESYKTGETMPDGFKDTLKLADIGFWAYIDKGNVPRAKVDLKCAVPGMGMSAIGLELPAPSYEGLLQLQDMMKGE